MEARFNYHWCSSSTVRNYPQAQTRLNRINCAVQKTPFCERNVQIRFSILHGIVCSRCKHRVDFPYHLDCDSIRLGDSSGECKTCIIT